MGGHVVGYWCLCAHTPSPAITRAPRLSGRVRHAALVEASTQQEADTSSSALADDGDSEDEMVRALEQEMASEAPGGAPSEAPEAPGGALARLLEGVRRIEEAQNMYSSSN